VTCIQRSIYLVLDPLRTTDGGLGGVKRFPGGFLRARWGPQRLMCSSVAAPCGLPSPTKKPVSGLLYLPRLRGVPPRSGPGTCDCFPLLLISVGFRACRIRPSGGSHLVLSLLSVFASPTRLAHGLVRRLPGGGRRRRQTYIPPTTKHHQPAGSR